MRSAAAYDVWRQSKKVRVMALPAVGEDFNALSTLLTSSLSTRLSLSLSLSFASEPLLADEHFEQIEPSLRVGIQQRSELSI